MAFIKKSRQNPGKIFWDWFVNHKKELENYLDKRNIPPSFIKNLNRLLHVYHPHVHAEFTVNDKGQYVLVLTADGMREGIKPVIKLAEMAPPLENWEIRKFRQPMENPVIRLGDFYYPTEKILVVPEIDREAGIVHLDMYVPELSMEPDLARHLAFLYLDHGIGEYNTMTKVGGIEFYDLPEEDIPGSMSLNELRRLIEREFYGVEE